MRIDKIIYLNDIMEGKIKIKYAKQLRLKIKLEYQLKTKVLGYSGSWHPYSSVVNSRRIL